MLHLMRAVDRASGCIFVPPPDAPRPPDALPMNPSESTAHAPNAYALMTSALAPIRGPMSDPRDVQERWVDARDAYEAHEKMKWRQEGEAVRELARKYTKESEAGQRKNQADGRNHVGSDFKIQERM